MVAVRVRPELSGIANEDGKNRLEGVLEATVLYMPGGSDLPASAQAELPFAIDAPMHLTDESWISVQVLSAEANALMSDRLEMKTMLAVSLETRERKTARVVQDVTEGEPIQRRSGLVLFWPEAGETAWDIGKKYALPVAEVEGEGETKRAIEPSKAILLKL